MDSLRLNRDTRRLYSGSSLPSVRWNILPPSSEYTSKSRKQPARTSVSYSCLLAWSDILFCGLFYAEGWGDKRIEEGLEGIEVLSWPFLGGTEENHRNLSQDSRCCGRSSNLRSSWLRINGFIAIPAYSSSLKMETVSPSETLINICHTKPHLIRGDGILQSHPHENQEKYT